MKRILCVLLSLALLVCLCACAGEEQIDLTEKWQQAAQQAEASLPHWETNLHNIVSGDVDEAAVNKMMAQLIAAQQVLAEDRTVFCDRVYEVLNEHKDMLVEQQTVLIHLLEEDLQPQQMKTLTDVNVALAANNASMAGWLVRYVGFKNFGTGNDTIDELYNEISGIIDRYEEIFYGSAS